MASVSKVGSWAVVEDDEGQRRALSRRCRHQLGDLSQGSVGPDGCLVCPWHQSRYDTRTGEMVAGPRGFLGYHGPTPGYSGLVRLLGRVVPLRVRSARRVSGEVVVEDADPPMVT